MHFFWLHFEHFSLVFKEFKSGSLPEHPRCIFRGKRAKKHIVVVYLFHILCTHNSYSVITNSYYFPGEVSTSYWRALPSQATRGEEFSYSRTFKNNTLLPIGHVRFVQNRSGALQNVRNYLLNAKCVLQYVCDLINDKNKHVHQ